MAGPAAAELPPPLTEADFIDFDPAQAAIGRLLFYDKILSGNRNISCSTCHHPAHGTSDGLSLGIGEGGIGLGPKRTAGTGADRIPKRIPRNASALWNLGAREIHTMFHDGRLMTSGRYGNGFDSPAEEWLPTGFNSILAAQAVFPLVAQFEMAGNPRENEIAGAVHDRIDAAWPIIAKRVRIIPAYGEAFVAAFDHITSADQVTVVEITNALAAFMATEWQSIDSPFDAYLNGDASALTSNQRAGLNLFYGKANCARCHTGALLSDQDFHALALPQFGPGRTRPLDPIPRDVGRMGKSDDLSDAYRFRTPMLRNVELTAPYGHNGAYPNLDGIIRHHVEVNPGWTRELIDLPQAEWLAASDFAALDNRLEAARHSQVRDTSPLHLSDQEVAELVAFLHALTGSSAKQSLHGIPTRVPSEIPVD